jgi:hypothetical protein
MKPVEDVFSSDIFRRVVLPGIVLSGGLHPFVSPYFPAISQLYGIGSTSLIVAEILVLGLVVSSGVQWIYYVYEGFRLPWLTSFAWKINHARVEAYQRRSQQIRAGRDFEALSPSEQEQVTRLYEFLCDFPVETTKDGLTRHYAERPTRLGNIIATYELYADTRYGIDGTFFWDHLLNLTADSSRKAFDDAYAFAESLVLASFAGAVVMVSHLVALVGFGIGLWNSSLIVIRTSLSPSTSVWTVLVGLVIWLGFYQVSLPAHRDAGASFRAIVDGVMPKFIEWAKSLVVPLPEDTVKAIEALNEYLKNPTRPKATAPP